MQWHHESEEFDKETVTDAFILYDRAITRREKATAWPVQDGHISKLDAFIANSNW